MTEAERLAKFLDRINDIMGETAYGAGLREAAAELRRLAGYEAEAKAARQYIRSDGEVWCRSGTRSEFAAWMKAYVEARADNEANEPPPTEGKP